MKKAFMIFSVVLLVLIAGLTGCGKKVKEPVVTKPEPVNYSASDFTPSGQCQYCHRDIFEQWSTSMHALTLTNPVYLAAAKRTSSGSSGKSDNFCAACHSPIGLIAGEVSGGITNPGKSASQAVSCDFCHAVTGSAGIGNASYLLSPGKVKFGPLDDPIATPIHDSAYAQIFTKAEYCGMCHDISHPENGLALASTYSEWKSNSFASKKIECQDCHMTPGPGATKPNPGVTATGAPKQREHTWTHNFTGGNLLVPRLAGQGEQAARAEDQLRAAAELFLGLPESFKPYQPVKFNVRVRNSGAGHYLPTGLTMFKEMWLEIKVTDDQGRVVYSSGVIDEAGLLPKGTVIYNTVLADESGRETFDLWSARTVIYDRRIPSQKYVDEYFEVPVAPDRGTLNVSVRLLYRGSSQKLVSSLLGTGAPRVPVVEMAAATGKIVLK